ncbi:MAG TPA: nucleoside recognition domain-containing protein, partial [Sunxiuqinia sp.]|nr:nucleoside recognition domain-containing protein [Sunxiuqinia sp.]
GSQYLTKMGNVILLASILIWALGYYPRHVDYTKNYASMLSMVENNASLTATQKAEKTSDIQLSQEEERQSNSYIGQVGHFIEPVIRPLGFDWKIGMSIITGMAAKEIVVSSMGVLYNADLNADENSQSLKQKLQQQTFTRGPKTGEKVFSPLVAFALMIFVLIYFPCVAVVAAIRKEANWKWALFTTVYTTGIAWVAAFLVFQIGSLIV